MISITKTEAEAVRKQCPENHIRRACWQKSKRHHYWMSEDVPGMRLVAQMRGVPMEKLVKY